ncbi:MAG: D-alanyl-D-alanine carboxypeptidase/D-alanyl-D-alanine-endopeptidase [Syntrophales bacterium]|nr:D-alanyl-D-alanine carboxypeptidase/D-alanyl-D-alanine-endopeptidase [Syntrophales bacterium]
MATEYRNRSCFKYGLIPSLLSFILPICLIFSFTYLAPLVRAEEGHLSPAIVAIMEAPRYQHSLWGLCVVDLASGKPLYSLNADKMFGPASVTKLFTAAAALDELGRDYTVKTAVYQQGTVNKTGKLNGNLIVVGGGDIYLSDLRALAAQIKASGIKAVKGDVVIEDRLFKPYRAYSVLRPGRLLYVLSPALIHDDLVELTIRPTHINKAAAISWKPAIAKTHILCRVRTVSSKEPEKIEIDIDAAGHIIASGQIPENSHAVTKRAPVADPSSMLRSLLIDALKKAGVHLQASTNRLPPVHRSPAGGIDEKGMKKIAERVSPPLSTYLRNILKASHNQGADMLVLHLAVKKGGDTFEEGLKGERTFLSGAGIDLGAISLSDGSGISQANLVTPAMVVQLLKFMTTHKDFEAFLSGLPILGVDGTLADAVEEGSPMRGKVLAKTGTIGLFDLVNDSGFVQIKSLAGYITTATGRQLAFALFVNHVHATDAPDRISVLKQNHDVGTDLVKITESLYSDQ